MPEWQRVRLGEVLTPAPTARRESVQAEKEYRLLGVRLNNDGPFLRETKKGADSSAPSLFRVQAGDFIYSRLFAWRGALGLIPPELDGCYVSNEFPLFTAKDDRIDLEYLNFWFHLPDVIRRIEADCTGSTPLTRNRYKENFFLALELPLPPLPEQRRIVARVKGLLGKVEEARGLKSENTKHASIWLEAEIEDLFNGLNGFQTEKLKNLCSKIGSGSTPRGGREVYADEGVPIVRSLNVRWRDFTRNGLALILPEIHSRMSNTVVFSGDVLLNITGASIGRVAVVPSELLEANVNQHVCIIRAKSLNSRFLMYYLSSKNIQDLILSDQKGATRQAITKAQIENFDIPLLSMEEQNSIVETLDGLSDQFKTLTGLLSSSSRELDALPASILARGFAGAL